MGKKIVLVGPAHPYRGGIAAFSERLASALQAAGNEVELVTFTLQYPSFLFPGKTQYSDSPAPEGLRITRLLNSINPLSWLRTARALRRMNPDLVIYSYWMPAMAPALGCTARWSRLGGRSIALVHNLIPHEAHRADKLLSRFFCKSVGEFVALSEMVRDDILTLRCEAQCKVLPHPVYDQFGPGVPRDEACRALGLEPDRSYLMFFGLIREYKGLDLLLDAWASSERKASLIIAGEFYSNAGEYHDLAASLGIDGQVIWRTEYIPDTEVSLYFCAADLVVLPYRNATQSGVARIALNYARPVAVTRTGALAEDINDGVDGLLMDATPDSIRQTLDDFFETRPDFTRALEEKRNAYSWDEFCKNLLK